MKTFRIPMLMTAGLLAVAPLLLSGCASQGNQARRVELSGFLGNYEQLREGGEDEALRVFVDRDADWASYHSVQLDPVTIWRNKRTTDLSAEDAQNLSNELEAAIRKELGSDFTFVDRGGPGVLHVRIAITEAAGSNVVLDTVSTVVPQARVLSGLKRVATGTSAFVGTASVEGEILDSVSNRRIAAVVDRRAGGKDLSSFDKWNDVRTAFEFWAKKLRTRIGEWKTPARTDSAK
jgi:hypothetical protein